MLVIFRMALRNLLQHKSKTIIIGLFIAIGVTVIELGNGFLEATNRGMERDFRAHYTGDVVISAPAPKNSKMDLFGVSSMSLTEVLQIPAIEDIDSVEEVLSKTEGISKQTKIISSKALFMNGDFADFQMEDQNYMDIPVFFMFAGESPSFYDTFPVVNLVEGKLPTPGTNEVLVDVRLKKKFETFFKVPLELNKSYIVAGQSMNNTIRDAVISGFYEQPDKDSSMYSLIYCDPSFARAFAELTYANSFTQELPNEIDTKLSDFSEDDLFGDSFNTDDFGIISSGTNNYDNILGDTTLRDELNKTDDGAWHFIILKLDNPRKAESFISSLNNTFKENNISATAMNWKAASSTFSSTVEGIGIIFTVLVIILAIVVFIIIMNTMTISVIERTGEIGTMRALGAEKNFVRQLFTIESITITVLSSIAGTVLALIIMLIINCCHISLSNDIAKMLLGGGAISLIPTLSSIFGTIIIITIGCILANIYPVSTALKITPLKALSNGDN